MQLKSEIVLIDELVAATGKSEGWWMRNWLREHELRGFPRKLPMLWGWPRQAVEAWIRRGGARPAPANDDLPAAAALSDLDARLGMLP